MTRKTVFITGVTGSMGGAGLRELLQRRDRFDIVALVRSSQANRRKMAALEKESGLRIVWGDLTSYEDVLQCVTGADVVLHPAAMISPAADHNPAMARAINVGAAENIVRAIKAQPDPDAVRLVNIGSVAMTGDRLYPIHVGRTGDPLKPSIYDAYACSKIDAERVVAESGLRHWVSCRQTFIAIPDTMGLMDPIMFHQPLDTCIEFCTDADSGRLLANACEDDIAPQFWRRFYNIGGGPGARITFLGLMKRIYSALGMGSPEDLTQRNWFALRNFHCHWFEDSALLNDFLDFQRMDVDAWVQSVLDGSPWYVRLSAHPLMKPLMSSKLARGAIRKRLMLPLASGTPDSTQYWFENNIEGRISAFFGDRATWERIPQHWNDIAQPTFDEYDRLDHGYDESRDPETLDAAALRDAAGFRGGEFLSDAVNPGDFWRPLPWRCWRGHRFELSPNTVLRGGHWCPECSPQKIGWDYDNEARNNPFFAQVWYPNHDPREDNFYPPDCYRDVGEAGNN
ncbi:MAG: NAD-dependent epimerase/dehydratase family protein [Halioglobus sp.]|nr:NAD-dependent epimerase/dehydratase family protein [Halioglobus sp.]